MSKDAEAQRQVCIGLVGEAIARNSKYIDKTLQLSNLPALTGYLLGSSKGASGMPVASSSWEAEVVSGSFDQLAKQVRSTAVADLVIPHRVFDLCWTLSLHLTIVWQPAAARRQRS